MRPSGRAGVDTLHGLRPFCAWLFLGLVLVVCGERRLADQRYTLYNLARAEIGIKSAETLDGNEVALRLVAVDDARPSVLTTAPAPAAEPLVVHAPRAPRSLTVELPPLRAPPRAPAASA